MAGTPRRRRLHRRRLLRLVRPHAVRTRRGHDLGRLAALIVVASLVLATQANAQSVKLPRAIVNVTVEPNGVLDVLELVSVRAGAAFDVSREIAMRKGELFAQPSVVVDEHRYEAGDGKTPGTFLVSRGTRGVRITWRQPAGTRETRVGYRLALRGVAYADVVDLGVALWERDWNAPLARLIGVVRLPRAAPSRIYAWLHPDGLPAVVTTTRRVVRVRAVDVGPRQTVTLRVAFPRAVLRTTGGVDVRDGVGLPSIVADERGGDGGSSWWIWALVVLALLLAFSAGALRTARLRRPPRR